MERMSKEEWEVLSADLLLELRRLEAAEAEGKEPYCSAGEYAVVRRHTADWFGELVAFYRVDHPVKSEPEKLEDAAIIFLTKDELRLANIERRLGNIEKLIGANH
jgi:hypothetical protein